MIWNDTDCLSPKWAWEALDPQIDYLSIYAYYWSIIYLIFMFLAAWSLGPAFRMTASPYITHTLSLVPHRHPGTFSLVAAVSTDPSHYSKSASCVISSEERRPQPRVTLTH